MIENSQYREHVEFQPPEHVEFQPPEHIASQPGHLEFKAAVNILLKKQPENKINSKKINKKTRYDKYREKMFSCFRNSIRNLRPIAENVEALQEKSDETINKALSIFIYTTEFGHKQLNKFLKNESNKKDIKPYIDTLTFTLQELPPFVECVFRWENLKKESEYLKDRVICHQKFISTSMSSTLQFKDKKYTFRIASKNGRDISHFSEHIYEREVLFRPGTSFIVTFREDKNIGMQEI